MTQRMLALVGCVAWLAGSATPCRSFTLDECEQWIDQLRQQTGEVAIAGDRSDDERRKLVEGVDAARSDGAQPREPAEAASRCPEAVEQGGSRRGFIETKPGDRR